MGELFTYNQPVETEHTTFPAKAAVWDLDDTIARAPHYPALQQTLRMVGITEFTPQACTRYAGGKPLREGITAVLDAEGITIDDKRLDELVVAQRALVSKLIDRDGVEAFPSSVKIMKELKGRGVKIGVASSSHNADSILAKCYTVDADNQKVPAELLDLVDVIVAEKRVIRKGTEYVKADLKGKPAPDIFLTACDELGILPSEALGFEDAVSGITAFKAAGIVSVGLSRTGNREELVRAGANTVVGDLSETNINGLATLFKEQRASI